MGLSGLSPVHSIPGIPYVPSGNYRLPHLTLRRSRRPAPGHSDSDGRSGLDSEGSPTKKSRPDPATPKPAAATPPAATTGQPKRVLWIPNVDDDDDGGEGDPMAD